MNIDFKTLTGKKIVAVQMRDDELHIITDGGEFRMIHYQDCCESVYLADGLEDLQDIIGQTVNKAWDVSEDASQEEAYEDSATYTFYHIVTNEGRDVCLRWIGASNGYYSESVTFERVSDTVSHERDGHDLLCTLSRDHGFKIGDTVAVVGCDGPWGRENPTVRTAITNVEGRDLRLRGVGQIMESYDGIFINGDR